MIRIFAVIIALGTVFSQPAEATSISGPAEDPRKLYGNGLEFDVLRNGDVVGSHSVRFIDQNKGFQAISEMNIAISFLFFEAYSYDYSSVAEWQDGRLTSIDVQVDDDGDIQNITARADEKANMLVVEGPEGEDRAPLGIYPTNHWSSDVLGSTKVLNTLTGQINSVEIVSKGMTTVETSSGPIQATHYAYTGDLETEVWYDEAGRWVKMRFVAKDGSIIEHRCKKCGLTENSYRGS